MRSPKRHPTRKLFIIAQDPGVRVAGRIVRAQVEIPAEHLRPGPHGYRIRVVDYDGSRGRSNPPCRIPARSDPYARKSDDQLLADPRFHCQNVYAIAMRTLARFEHALGRRVAWGFSGHQLRVAPHAFAAPNAYYSPEQSAIVLGYFPGRRETVYTCLSHDIVAHEVTHALLHGLRRRYLEPASADQAAFHEGFADLVALFSVLSLPGVIAALVSSTRLRGSELSAPRLRRSMLFGLAKQVGEEISRVRGRPLRRSVELEPSPTWLDDAEFAEPHRRGEILVAAVMNAFLEVWLRRLEELGHRNPDRDRVSTEGAATADHLLSMCIRALDYAPPTDINFRDFITAVLTADHEINPQDSRHVYRTALRASFAGFGIEPVPAGDSGVWEPPESALVYERSHFESLQRDPEEVFRFIWENRRVLRLCEGAETQVQSVRPSVRVGADGFVLRETVAEYVQELRLRAGDLGKLRIRRPPGMPADSMVTLVGGGVLIFDEFGRLKYHIGNRVDHPARQTARLAYAWRREAEQSSAQTHRRRRPAA